VMVTLASEVRALLAGDVALPMLCRLLPPPKSSAGAREPPSGYVSPTETIADDYELDAPFFALSPDAQGPLVPMPSQAAPAYFTSLPFGPMSSPDMFEPISPVSEINLPQGKRRRMLPAEASVMHRPCTQCRTAKVKCNREAQCSRCIKLGIVCKLPPSPNPRRQRSSMQPTQAKEDSEVSTLKRQRPSTDNSSARSGSSEALGLDVSLDALTASDDSGSREDISPEV